MKCRERPAHLGGFGRLISADGARLSLDVFVQPPPRWVAERRDDLEIGIERGLLHRLHGMAADPISERALIDTGTCAF